MAEITAAIVKALREQTGQGMMECKNALQEADGDMSAAADILRKKGLVTAEKKASRTTSEGRVAIKLSGDGTSAAMVEVRCETDFCARNDVFVEMVESLAEIALAGEDGSVEATEEMTSAVQGALAKIGENMKYVRGVRTTAPRVGTYLHHNNKVAVLVGVNGEISDETLSDLCMHVAFADPMGITTDDVPPEVVEKEKAFATQEAIDSGKPPQIAEKIVSGKLAKFLAGKALLEQPFVRDDKKKVKDILGDATIASFARYAVGE
jgi:elongation factor Ts